MPGVVSSPASLSSIKTVFGGPNNFSSYIKGGSYVPDDAAMTGVNTTTDGLAISQFSGKSIPYITVTGQNLLNATGGFAGSLTWGISTDGRSFFYKDNQAATYIENVFTTNGTTLDSSNIGYYEIYATSSGGTGGTFSGSAFNTWHTIGGTARYWQLGASPNKFVTGSVTISIRRISIPGITTAAATINYELDTTP